MDCSKCALTALVRLINKSFVYFFDGPKFEPMSWSNYKLSLFVKSLVTDFVDSAKKCQIFEPELSSSNRASRLDPFHEIHPKLSVILLSNILEYLLETQALYTGLN